jgi:sRNA-binding regulator protein Hfq
MLIDVFFKRIVFLFGLFLEQRNRNNITIKVFLINNLL